MMPVSRAMVALGAAAFLVTAPATEAQTTFQGTSSGSFTNGSSTGLASLGGLTFGAPGTSWSFDLFVGQTLTGLSFGTMYLDRGVAFNYGSGGDKYFDLNLNFTQPGGGNQVFIGALSGNITDGGNGQVNIHFNGPFTAVLNGGYSVLIDVNDITGAPAWSGTTNQTAGVNGSMTFVSGPNGGGTGGTETAPEPVTMVLIGTGLAGVAAAKRRKQTSAA